MTITEFWDELEIDKEEVTARFVGNLALAQRCTKKYIDDKTFGELTEAIENNDYKLIEISAHTLKGVAGNLGFSKIHKVGQKIVDDVRAGVYDNLMEEYEVLKEEHLKVCGLAEKLEV